LRTDHSSPMTNTSAPTAIARHGKGRGEGARVQMLISLFLGHR
jgi:hypothetical protein